MQQPPANPAQPCTQGRGLGAPLWWAETAAWGTTAHACQAMLAYGDCKVEGRDEAIGNAEGPPHGNDDGGRGGQRGGHLVLHHLAAVGKGHGANGCSRGGGGGLEGHWQVAGGASKSNTDGRARLVGLSMRARAAGQTGALEHRWAATPAALLGPASGTHRAAGAAPPEHMFMAVLKPLPASTIV